MRKIIHFWIMKREIIIICFLLLFFGFVAQSQNRLFSKKFEFDSTFQIISVCAFADKEMAYKNFTFQIENLDSIKKAQKEITYGKEFLPTREEIMKNNFPFEKLSVKINVVRNKKSITYFQYKPIQKFITFGDLFDSIGGTFNFDITELIKKADNKPLDYEAKKITFRSKGEKENYIKNKLSNKRLLFYEDATLSYEGSFEVIIKGDKNFTTQTGFKMFANEFERLGINNSEYLLAYSPKVLGSNVYHYNIYTRKNIYDTFKLKGYKKGKWKETEIQIFTYWLQ